MMRGFVLLLGVLQLVAASPVAACWCLPAGNATVKWPQDGALEVAPDTAIVAWRNYAGDGRTGLEVVLTGPDGEQLAIEEVRYAPEWWQCSGETVFFQPKEPLVEGSSYVASTHAGRDPKPLHSVTFTVANKPWKPRAELDPEVTYLSLRADPSHRSCYAGCLDMAEIRVDLGQVPETPVWLFVRSDATPYQNNIWEFGPELLLDVAEGEPDPRQVRQVSVHAPLDNPCVDIGIYGVDGKPLFEERRCQPDRCVVYGARFTNLCNHPPLSYVDASRISDRSCDDPPQLVESDKHEIIYPPIEAGAEQKSKRGLAKPNARLPDCSTLQPSAAATHVWPLVLALVAGLLLRRRCA